MTLPIHQPKPNHFGMRGMCAALNMTEAEFIEARVCGEIATPDTVHMRAPRWSAMALGLELDKRMPTGVNRLIYSLEALQRAEHAEGWFDEGAQS